MMENDSSRRGSLAYGHCRGQFFLFCLRLDHFCYCLVWFLYLRLLLFCLGQSLVQGAKVSNQDGNVIAASRFIRRSYQAFARFLGRPIMPQELKDLGVRNAVRQSVCAEQQRVTDLQGSFVNLWLKFIRAAT